MTRQLFDRFSKTSGRWQQPIDRVALVMMAVLTVLMVLLAASGDHTAPRVRDFSWGDRHIGASDRAFLMTFSRPMNRESVERNLKIEPELPGKFSWAGRRMAYTLDVPIPYGTEFVMQLQGARDRFSEPGDDREMGLFESRFQSRDRAFIYLGVEGDEAGRLVLNNLTQDTQDILTPANLVVMNYEPYPRGDRILFSATDRTGDDPFGLDQRIYSVTTGVQVIPPENPLAPERDRPNPNAEPDPPGIVELLLDNQDYQNLKFDLAPNGKFFVVQRVSRDNPGDVGLWKVIPGEDPQPIETEPGGDFLITPDSTTLAMAQGQGMAILPLEDGTEPLDFLPRFGVVLSFAPDGSAATMIQFNPDPVNPTRSLFLVTSQGQETELLTTDGSILDTQFDPTQTWLYCLLTVRVPGDEFIEQPVLSAINLETGDRTDLLKLPIQRDIQMSLSPDGLGILFDQIVTEEDLEPSTPGLLQGSDGKPIASSRLWFLPILLDDTDTPTAVDPQALPIAGLRPRWLP